MSDEEVDQQGWLHKDAAKALMRLLWLSRLSRPDIFFIVRRLAANVSRWSRWVDRQLHRLEPRHRYIYQQQKALDLGGGHPKAL